LKAIERCPPGIVRQARERGEPGLQTGELAGRNACAEGCDTRREDVHVVVLPQEVLRLLEPPDQGARPPVPSGNRLQQIPEPLDRYPAPVCRLGVARALNPAEIVLQPLNLSPCQGSGHFAEGWLPLPPRGLQLDLENPQGPAQCPGQLRVPSRHIGYRAVVGLLLSVFQPAHQPVEGRNIVRPQQL